MGFFGLILAIAVCRVIFVCFLHVSCDNRGSRYHDKQVPEGIITKSFNTFSNSIKKYSINLIRKTFPSPHSELLLGMTIGFDDLKSTPTFNDVLKTTGTIHVVVVSGFNISLVFSLILKILGSRYQLRNLVLALLTTFLYALISGFEAPVIRAWVMGSVSSIGTYYGRSLAVIEVLIFSAAVLLIIKPAFFFDFSFILSFAATLSLMLFSESFMSIFSRLKLGEGFLVQDLASSFSAQILVWPIISAAFGTVSLISVFVNMLVVWTVSFSTIFGLLLLMFGWISPLLNNIVAIPLYLLLDFFVSTVYFCAKVPFSQVDFKINSLALFSYYMCVLCAVFILKRHKYE